MAPSRHDRKTYFTPIYLRPAKPTQERVVSIQPSDQSKGYRKYKAPASTLCFHRNNPATSFLQMFPTQVISSVTSNRRAYSSFCLAGAPMLYRMAFVPIRGFRTLHSFPTPTLHWPPRERVKTEVSCRITSTVPSKTMHTRL